MSRRNRKGLTLVELLIVILILGALAAIAIPKITTSATNAKRRVCETNIDTMNTMIEVYYADEDSYPSTLSTLTADPNYFPDGAPACPFGTAYSNTLTSYNRVDTTGHSH